jgi:hypothetical protein
MVWVKKSLIEAQFEWYWESTQHLGRNCKLQAQQGQSLAMILSKA